MTSENIIFYGLSTIIFPTVNYNTILIVHSVDVIEIHCFTTKTVNKNKTIKIFYITITYKEKFKNQTNPYIYITYTPRRI